MRKFLDSVTNRLARIASRSPSSSGKSRSIRSRHLAQGFEPLEQRALLSVTSEGLDALNLDDVQARFGVFGDGVKIGVIANGIGSLAASQSSGDLPGTITSSGPGSGTQGTAMLEVIHDVAPNAALYFAPASTEAQFVSAVNYLATTQDVDVIVSAAGIYNQPWFTNGAGALAAQSAVTAGKVFVSAAGDDGQIHYQGTFSGTGSNTHNFGGGADLLVVDVTAGAGAVNAHLQWSEPWQTPTDSYSIYLYGRTGGGAWTEIDSDTDLTDTYQVVSYGNASGYDQLAVKVVDEFGFSADTIEIMITGPVSETDAGDLQTGESNNYTPNNAVFGPAAISSVMTVGTINMVTTPSLDEVAADSSRGATMDGLAVDQVTTTVLGTENFVGTSAAAAHMGGAAALLLQASSFTFDPATIAGIFAGTAVDIGGTAQEQGAGRYDLLESAYSIYQPEAPILAAGSDRGVSASDKLTNNSTALTFVNDPLLPVPPGSTIRLFVDGNEVAEDTVNAFGNYSITVDLPTVVPGWTGDGAHSITVQVKSGPGATYYPGTASSALVITTDDTLPTADIIDITPDPRDTTVSNVVLDFSEAVFNVTTADITLTNGGGNLLTGSHSVSQNTPSNFTLSDISDVTGDNGTYTLTLSSAGSVTDEAGNPLAANASDSWDMYDLVVNGTAGADTIIVTTDLTNHTVKVNGISTIYPAATYNEIYIDGAGGEDLIFIYDSTLDDEFVTGSAQMDWGSDSIVNVTATGFEYVYGLATNGGNDTATMNGTAGTDKFFGRETYGQMQNVGGTPYFHYASGFDTVTANGGGGADIANLYGSANSDTFAVGPGVASMTRAGSTTSVANGFVNVSGIATAGGTDTATMTGTAGTDKFFGRETYGQLQNVGGSNYFYYASGFGTTTAVGGGGSDTALLYGSANSDAFAVSPGAASITRAGSTASVATGFATVFGTALAGGTDTATMTGSAGSDKFYGRETYGQMENVGGTAYFHYASGFGTVTGEGGGGTDSAYLYGSASNDTFTVSPGASSMMRAGSTSSHANGFSTVFGTALAGGTDTATMTGSAGTDKFFGRETYSQMQNVGGTNYFHYASGFNTLTGIGGGGTDSAFLYGSAGSETFVVSPGAASMTRAGSTTSAANGFATVYGTATAGGTDTATMTGSTGTDKFFGRETYSQMQNVGGTDYFHYAAGFGTVTGVGGGGTDTANLYGSATSDTFDVSPGVASMTRAGSTTSEAMDFANVSGIATTGGTDTATMTGSTGSDKFFGYETYAQMQNVGGANYFHYAAGFSTITGDGGGGADTANLYGSANSDTFDVGPGAASMMRAGSTTSEANNFSTVSGVATAGGTDIATITGSTGNDKFYGYETYAHMFDAASSAFYYYAGGFSSVTGIGGGGTLDLAYLYDSAGNDAFIFNQQDASASLASGKDIDVVAFDRIYAIASTGLDTADMFGTAGDDTFYGRSNYGYMQDTAGTSYLNYILAFDEVFADPGDFDIGNDTLDVPDPITDLDYDLFAFPEW